IINYISSNQNHPSATIIYHSLKKKLPKLSLSTVYQNLDALKKNGVIKEITIKNGPNRYDINTNNHYHIICQSCGKVRDFNYPVLHEIEKVASSVFDYEIYTHSLEIYGK